MDEVGQLQVMLEEFDDAYNKLKDFYNPKVVIKRIKYFKGDYYQGVIKFSYPEPRELKVSLGKVSDFRGENDKNLIALAEKKGREKIRKEFPLYFL